VLAIAIRDHHGTPRALRDPATCAVVAFDADRAWGVARYLMRQGVDVHGLFRAPPGSRHVRSTEYAHHVADVAQQDSRKLQHH
jgi:hypothetical protein